MIVRTPTSCKNDRNGLSSLTNTITCAVTFAYPHFNRSVYYGERSAAESRRPATYKTLSFECDPTEVELQSRSFRIHPSVAKQLSEGRITYGLRTLM